MTSADFYHTHDPRRGDAVRLPHKTGAALQWMPSRRAKRVAWAVLPNLIGAALFLLVVGLVVGVGL